LFRVDVVLATPRETMLVLEFFDTNFFGRDEIARETNMNEREKVSHYLVIDRLVSMDASCAAFAN